MMTFPLMITLGTGDGFKAKIFMPNVKDANLRNALRDAADLPQSISSSLGPETLAAANHFVPDSFICSTGHGER